MAKRHAAEWMFDEDEPRVAAVTHARGKALLRLSNETTLKVSGTALQMVGLVRGDVIDAVVRKKLVEAEAVAEAVRKGVRMLTASAKTAAEVRDRLLAKDLDAKVVERAVAYLVERGLIDDAEVAKRVSADRTASREMARQVMEARGVEGAVAEETLANRGSDARGAKKAVRVLGAKLAASLSVSAKRGRLLSALARRGFEEHDAVDAVDGYLRGE